MRRKKPAKLRKVMPPPYKRHKDKRDKPKKIRTWKELMAYLREKYDE
jgi:hypothetical protein